MESAVPWPSVSWLAAAGAFSRTSPEGEQSERLRGNQNVIRWCRVQSREQQTFMNDLSRSIGDDAPRRLCALQSAAMPEAATLHSDFLSCEETFGKDTLTGVLSAPSWKHHNIRRQTSPSSSSTSSTTASSQLPIYPCRTIASIDAGLRQQRDHDPVLTDTGSASLTVMASSRNYTCPRNFPENGDVSRASTREEIATLSGGLCEEPPRDYPHHRCALSSRLPTHHTLILERSTYNRRDGCDIDFGTHFRQSENDIALLKKLNHGGHGAEEGTYNMEQWQQQFAIPSSGKEAVAEAVLSRLGQAQYGNTQQRASFACHDACVPSKVGEGLSNFYGANLGGCAPMMKPRKRTRRGRRGGRNRRRNDDFITPPFARSPPQRQSSASQKSHGTRAVVSSIREPGVPQYSCHDEQSYQQCETQRQAKSSRLISFPKTSGIFEAAEHLRICDYSECSGDSTPSPFIGGITRDLSRSFHEVDAGLALLLAQVAGLPRADLDRGRLRSASPNESCYSFLRKRKGIDSSGDYIDEGPLHISRAGDRQCPANFVPQRALRAPSTLSPPSIMTPETFADEESESPCYSWLSG